MIKYKKGGILIENLIALLYITVILLPFTNLLIKVFKTNTLIEQKESENIALENILEYLENLEYDIIKNKKGVFHFNSLKEFSDFFQINPFKIINNKNFSINIKIQKTSYFYLNKNYEKLFIYKIETNNKHVYLLPDKEDYEK